jgi:hypothetical protein
MSMQQARFRLFINGSYCDAKSTFASIDPATGEPWAVMPAADEDEVDAAVQAAHRALHSGPWAKLNATQRGNCSCVSMIWWLQTPGCSLISRRETPVRSSAKPGHK